VWQAVKDVLAKSYDDAPLAESERGSELDMPTASAMLASRCFSKRDHAFSRAEVGPVFGCETHAFFETAFLGQSAVVDLVIPVEPTACNHVAQRLKFSAVSGEFVPATVA
jgi:hypothetical protein